MVNLYLKTSGMGVEKPSYLDAFSSCFVVFLGRLPKVELIILEGGGNVRPYVRPSVHKKFLRFQ